MEPMFGTKALISSAELALAVGADIDTINNWIRRGIISRSPIGGRQLRTRLFSAEEVFKTALKVELVKLGISPLSANEAIHTLWRNFDKKQFLEGRNIFAIILPVDDKWDVILCRREKSRIFYKLNKSAASKQSEVELPDRTFAAIPLADVFGRLRKKLDRLLAATPIA